MARAISGRGKAAARLRISAYIKRKIPNGPFQDCSTRERDADRGEVSKIRRKARRVLPGDATPHNRTVCVWGGVGAIKVAGQSVIRKRSYGVVAPRERLRVAN